MQDARKEWEAEARRETAVRIARNMLSRGVLTLEEIADYTQLSLSEVMEIAKKATA